MKGCEMVEVTSIEVVDDRRVHLRFSDSSERVVDLTPFLWGPAFEKIVDPVHRVTDMEHLEVLGSG
jgi:hypothetical protein